MVQLGELQEIYQEFEKRGITVIGLANEEKSLYEHKKTIEKFEGAGFELVADINRRKTKMLERTTAYLVDKKGIIRQIFPMEIYNRPQWWPILNEIDRLFPEGAR